MPFGKPKDPTLAVVPDEGAVAVILEALAGAAITPAVRRVPYNPFRPGLTGTSYELRVREEQLAAAKEIVAALSVEVALDLEAQALAAPPPAELPRRRRKKESR